MAEEPVLAANPSRISGKAAILPNDSMTGKDNGHSVRTNRSSDGSLTTGATDRLSDAVVGDRLVIIDLN